MERLKAKYRDAARALDTLEAVLTEPYSVLVRDATIQRFEYTFEACWKLLKSYLMEREGVDCRSPKGCFRESLTLGLLPEYETEVFLEMTDLRNETSHAYKEEVAALIFGKVSGYAVLMRRLLENLQARL